MWKIDLADFILCEIYEMYKAVQKTANEHTLSDLKCSHASWSDVFNNKKIP